MASADFSLASLNVNGLNIELKRRAIFARLKAKKYDIIFYLQETHSTPSSEAIWRHQ